MSSIKCEACGYRNTLGNGRSVCVNCGAPLQSRQMEARAFDLSPAEIERAQPPIPASPEAIKKHSTPTQPLLPLEAESMRQPQQTSLPGGERSGQPQHPILLKDLEEQYALQLREEERSRALQPRDEMSPYTIPDGSPLSYYDPAEGIRTVIKEEQGLRNPQHALPPWQLDRLPFGFPRRAPELWGAVVQVQSQQERPPMVGAALLFRGLRDIVWAMPNEIRHPDRDMVQVTTIRVRKADGALQDARVQGYLRGANVSLGDMVSIWGRRSRGAIYIYRAFNHTAKGQISTSATASSGPFFALLIILVLVAILAVYYLQIPIPFLPKLPFSIFPGN
ncbi:hypothetical protein [Ktedonospora formicarum]|uniref:Uncharacterized protein n=1 Tax=Ktedonospora formicarum TaxID=2778364 RepID=A0A8J3HY55_9CHLR|nr:hypothetical protein [Ktedonospora formicarum]GHO42787.1 hypothetical protein KSX_09500 [Ktedonospora formicarum]